jgi:hypothetical protein
LSARTEPGFAKEIDLCAAFIEEVRKAGKWEPYAETGGFDILLVRKVDGFQIGVEAKLKLNGKVIAQTVEDGFYWNVAAGNPDCRAVLIPYGVSIDLGPVCKALGITVIRMRPDGGKGPGYSTACYSPALPEKDRHSVYADWFERAPAQRIKLPDWVPDVIAGDKSPVALTEWKVKAIKIAATIEIRGFVTRQDFKHHQIHMPRWIDPYSAWLVKNDQGQWVAGQHMPDFRAQHPVNFEQIKADAAKWMPTTVPAVQGALSI